MSAENGEMSGNVAIEIWWYRESGPERADALSLRNSGAQLESTQSPGCAESGGLLTIFLAPGRLPEAQ
jgi:hypothetical protein